MSSTTKRRHFPTDHLGRYKETGEVVRILTPREEAELREVEEEYGRPMTVKEQILFLNNLRAFG